jgi:hypothetical protein
MLFLMPPRIFAVTLFGLWQQLNITFGVIEGIQPTPPGFLGDVCLAGLIALATALARGWPPAAVACARSCFLSASVTAQLVRSGGVGLVGVGAVRFMVGVVPERMLVEVEGLGFAGLDLRGVRV